MERRYLQLAVIPNPELKEPASTFQQLHAIASAEDRGVSVQGTNETAAASAGGAGVVAVSIVRDVTVLEISRLFYRPAPCHCQARPAVSVTAVAATLQFCCRREVMRTSYNQKTAAVLRTICSFRECCSRCSFQPCDCVYIRFVE